MRQSMSRAANCYDNAFMESCFGTIKTELEMTEYEDSRQARTRDRQLPGLLQPRAPTLLPRITSAPAAFEAQLTGPNLSNSTVRNLPSSSVHHILDRRQRPDLAFEWSNLQALTQSCHSRITRERQIKCRNGKSAP